MHILMIHNSYQFRGGEDISTEQDISLLHEHGHTVIEYRRNNTEIQTYSLIQKIGLFFRTTWSWKSYFDIKSIINKHTIDIVHVQNFFPLISPSVFWACSSENIAVVWSVRNYRLLCANGFFLRDNQPCEACVLHNKLKAIQYGCYRGSRLQSVAVVTMQYIHNLSGTWKKKITCTMPVSNFAAEKIKETHIPDAKIIARPNYLTKSYPQTTNNRNGAVFIGRLSPEKGIDVIKKAWEELPDIPLTMIGNGPEYESLLNWASTRENVNIVGQLPHDEMMDFVSKAQFLIMPSIWYETFGRTIVEAFAVGTPVIASKLGAMEELVNENENGLLFNAGDSICLREKVIWALEHPIEMENMGKAARETFQLKYSGERAYQNLITIYEKALFETAKN